MRLPRSTLFRLLSFYPPFFGAGIRFTHVAQDFRAIDVQMRLRWWNRNYILRLPATAANWNGSAVTHWKRPSERSSVPPSQITLSTAKAL